MRIAVSTADGISVCGHLGRVGLFFIYEVEGNTVVSKELRSVIPVHGPGEHHHHGHDHHDHNHHHPGHGTLVEALSDCSAVITNGMGGGLANAIAYAGMDPVITPESNPDTAVLNYLNGTLETADSCSH